MLERRYALGAITAVWATIASAGACGGSGPSNPLSSDGGIQGAPDSGSPVHACVPGQQIACICPGGAAGAQVCSADGQGYGVCVGCGGGETDGPAPLPDAAIPPDDASTSDDASSDANGALDATQDGALDGAPDGNVDATPDSAADASCASVTIATNRQPVSMMFVLDGSGSMQLNNKWIAVTGALTSIFNDMASKNDPGLYAGLIVFSDTNDVTLGSGPYPGSNDIPIAQVTTAHATALEARYGGGDQPSAATPTGAALAGGYSTLESFTAAGPGAKKALILLTDGVPTDNCAVVGGNYTGDPCIVEAATEHAKVAPQGPIETFAIGVGVYPSTDVTAFDPSFLGNLARSGGSGPSTCNPNANTAGASLCYFEVDPSGSSTATQVAFENAINAIRGQITSCTFAFSAGDAGTINPSKINVTLNGLVLPENPLNGWTFDNPATPTAVILHGAACTTATTTPNATVDVLLGCPTQQ